MYLVDVHDVIPSVHSGGVLAAASTSLYTVHNHLDAVLKVTAILRASQQRTHVELIHLAAHQSFRHLTLFDESHQSPDQCRLAHTRLADMQRIVLVAAAQHLNGPLQLLLTANQRILLLIQVVHARHQFLPCCIWLSLIGIRFQLVIKVIATDELTQEMALLVYQCIL